MRHLRFAAFEVALLPDGVIRAARFGPLIALRAAALAVSASRLRAGPTAVAVASVAVPTDADQPPATKTIELAMSVRHWPRRARWVMPRTRVPLLLVGPAEGPELHLRALTPFWAVPAL